MLIIACIMQSMLKYCIGCFLSYLCTLQVHNVHAWCVASTTNCSYSVRNCLIQAVWWPFSFFKFFCESMDVAWMSHGCVVVVDLERGASTRIWSKLNNIYRLPFFLSAMCNRAKYFAHVCFIGSSIEAVDLIFLSILLILGPIHL